MSDPLNRDQDALREAFASGVPTPPGAPDRASGARRFARRARRRRTTGVVAAVVAVVAAVATVPAVVGSGDRSSEPGPVASSSTTPTAVTIVCPRFEDTAGSDGPPEVGTDVVGVRLCSGSGTGYDAPATVLTADAAMDLAALVDRQPEYDIDIACPAEGGQGYLLVFAKADGSTQVVRGDLSGCGYLTVGGVEHLGTQEVLVAADAALSAQAIDSVACPTDDAPAGQSGPAELAPGAVAVRMCSGGGQGMREPPDELTAGVDELTDLINSSPVKPMPNTCVASMGLGFSLVFVYPDGHTQAVSGSTGGCDIVEVGGAIRTSAAQVWSRTVELWRAQRAGSTPPPDVALPRLGCSSEDDRGSFPLGLPLEMTTAVLCVELDRPTDPPPQEVAISDDDLADLVQALRTGDQVTPTDDPTCVDQPRLTLVGATDWGDRVFLGAYCGQWDVDGGSRTVVPGPAGQAVVDRLLAQVDDPLPEIDTATSPSQVVATYVELHQRGADDAASDVWVDPGNPDRPEPGVRILFNGDGTSDARATGWADAVEVRAFYSEGEGADYDEVTFLVVRQSSDEPYRILSLNR